MSRFLYILIIALILIFSVSTFGQDRVRDSTDRVTATVYNAVVEQCNSDPEHTAFMFKLDLSNPYKHRIIAVSRDLLTKYPKGTRVCISGTKYDGEYIVMDKMNKRYTNRIDILINQGMPLGKWHNVKIRKIDESK
tara:strand:+ start:361 stop:768 length:408 start_codon:yes stop_codon:yes gene_type:complete